MRHFFCTTLYRVYLLQARGQELSNHFSEIKHNLEEISIDLANHVDNEEARQLEVLIDRFSSAAPSPIRVAIQSKKFGLSFDVKTHLSFFLD